MPCWRVLNSGGPPMIRFLATGARSGIAFRLYFVAVSLVTTSESLSSAVAGSRIVSFGSILVASAASTSAVDSWVADFGSR